MKLPGPDHPITITANPKRVRVSVGGVVIADTTHALTLKEASYPAVHYVPREDANMALMKRQGMGGIGDHDAADGDADAFRVRGNGDRMVRTGEFHGMVAFRSARCDRVRRSFRFCNVRTKNIVARSVTSRAQSAKVGVGCAYPADHALG